MTAETIRQISSNALKPLIHVADVGPKAIKKFAIDCAILKEDYNNSDIRLSDDFKSLFAEIEQMKGPAVYYFEIISNHDPQDIVKRFEVYAYNQNSKNTPPVNHAFGTGKILYVGKVKKNIWGRLIQHLGYYKVDGTQGLQLNYWAKDISLKLELVVCEFEPEMSNLVGLFEFELASQKKPILGKHK